MPSYLALGRADAAGNVPPSQRINLACIGAGGRAEAVIPGLCAKGNAKAIAFADVDLSSGRIGATLKKFPDVKLFQDFRVMLDKMGDDIDAVSVVTPDHTHYVAALDAMRRGKHVYVEKPLTHSFKEAEMLMQAEKKYGVVTQMGNQGHTSAGSEQFKHLLEKGIIRDIVKIEAWKGPGLWFMEAEKRISAYPKGEPVPKSLDYELWCGPCAMKPFSRLYDPFSWRGFYLYGNGMLGDWGAHLIDFTQDWLKLGLPTKINALKMTDHNDVIFPLASQLSMEFPARGEGMPACEMIWRDGVGYEPELDERYWSVDAAGNKRKPGLGDAGTLLYRKDGSYVVQRGSHGSASRIYPIEKMKEFGADMKAKEPESDHMESFIQACKGNGKTQSPFSVGGELTQLLLLGVVCQYLNKNLVFDPATKRFEDNDQANAILDGPPPRNGWAEYYKTV